GRGGVRTAWAASGESAGSTPRRRGSTGADIALSRDGRGDGGEVDREDRSAARPAADVDGTAMVVGDAVGDVQAETAARVLGGDEGVEDVGCHFRRDARPGIGDLADAPGPVRPWRAVGADVYGATIRGRLDGVQDDVHQDLLHAAF